MLGEIEEGSLISRFIKNLCEKACGGLVTATMMLVACAPASISTSPFFLSSPLTFVVGSSMHAECFDCCLTVHGWQFPVIHCTLFFFLH